MSKSRRRTPKYRHYKPKDLGVVRIDGTDHYLGKYDSPESWEKYHRLIAEWLSDSQKALSISGKSEEISGSLSVSELILAYWRFASSHYVKDGEPTGELDEIRQSLLPLQRLYGRTPTGEFGPKKLKVVRQQMMDSESGGHEPEKRSQSARSPICMWQRSFRSSLRTWRQWSNFSGFRNALEVNESDINRLEDRLLNACCKLAQERIRRAYVVGLSHGPLPDLPRAQATVATCLQLHQARHRDGHLRVLVPTPTQTVLGGDWPEDVEFPNVAAQGGWPMQRNEDVGSEPGEPRHDLSR